MLDANMLDESTRPSKRARIEQQSDTAAAKPVKREPPSTALLLQWLSDQGVWISDKLQCRPMEDDGGLAMFARDVGVPQEVVAKMPKTAIISYRTSPLPDILPTLTLKQLPPIVILSLCVLYEIRQCKLSRYYGYVQSLPSECVPLATLWDIHELFGDDGVEASKWLVGTEVEREMKRMKKEGHGREDLQQYHAATASFFPLTPSHPSPPSFLDLLHAYSLVSSRAFQVDSYHRTALVPLADLFNHQEANHVAFESDDFICPHCGSLPTCPHGEQITPLSSTTSPRPAIPVRLSHLPTTLLESLSDPSQDTLDMAVHSPFTPGQEVFNSYGDHLGWAKLVAEYGFIDQSDDGDPIGKMGLRFDGKGVLRGDEDEEGLKGRDDFDERKAIWKKVAKSVAEEDFIHEDSDLTREQWERMEEESLLFHPTAMLECGNISAKDCLAINSEAQLSTPFFGLAVMDVLDGEVIGEADTKEIVNLVKRTMEVVERRWQMSQSEEKVVNDGASDERDVMVAREACERVIEVISNRIKATYQSSTSMSDILDERDNLPADRRLTRMAMSLLIEERRVLETAMTKIQEVVALL